MSRTIRILHFEDSEEDALLIARALRKTWPKIDVTRVDTEEDARSTIFQREWDAVLCDVKMPKFSVEQAIAIVHEHGRDIPFIIVSGTVDMSDAVGFMKAGVHDFVRKDDLARLVPALERELKEAANRRKHTADQLALLENEQRFRMLTQLYERTDSSLSELVAFSLERAVEITASRMGLLGIMDNGARDMEISHWSIYGMREDQAGSLCPKVLDDGDSQWSELIKTKQPVIINNWVLSDSDQTSLQQIPPFSKRFLGCPVIDQDRIVLVIGVIGRDTDYGPTEIQQLSLMLNSVWQIVKRKQAEQQLRVEEERLQQVDKMDALGSLAGGIAHDLKNMLFPILNLTEMVLKDIPESSRAHKRLEKVYEAAERAKSLTEKIHAFSHFDEAVRERREFCALLHNSLDFLKASLPSSVDLVEAQRKKVGMIEVDVARFQTMILNFGSNAVDAIGGKVGKLKFSVSKVHVTAPMPIAVPILQTGMYARLTISDTGQGMDANAMRHLFDPFFTTKERGKGAGLGMVMIQKFVVEYGGGIAVESKAGNGTVFEVYLPLVE